MQRLKTAVIVAGFAPAVILVVKALTDQLGANPVEALEHDTGGLAMWFLLASLAITPARKVFNQNSWIPYRKVFGLFSFFYASAHLFIYLLFDAIFSWSIIWEDISDRRFITIGFAAFLMLLPLAMTSTRGWIKKLGKRWVTLHRLVYLALCLAIVHTWWKEKADVAEPLMYAGLATLLLGYRIYNRMKGKGER